MIAALATMLVVAITAGLAPGPAAAQPYGPMPGPGGTQPYGPMPGPGGPQPYGAMPGPGPSPYARFRLVRVMDQHGFAQPVEAYRLLVPADWHVQAWVQWRPEIVHCPAHPIDSGVRLTAPDGITALELFAPNVWRWMDDAQSRQIIQQAGGGCPWASVLNAPEYLRQALPRVRPGAQVVAAERDPRLGSAIEAEMRTDLGPSIQAGFIEGFRVDAGRFRLSYALGGRPVEEVVSGVLRIVVQKSPSYGQVAGLGGGPLRTYYVTAMPWIAGRAPQGWLERATPLFAAIVGSVSPNLQWLRAVQITSLNISNTQLRGTMARAEIWRQAQQEIGQIYSQAYANQQRVQGSLAQQYSEAYRGVETFVDRITGERVELSGGYRQAWTNGRGEYILSNDANFNPAVTFRERWEEMPRSGRQ